MFRPYLEESLVNTTDCTDSADLEYGLTGVRMTFRLSLTKRVYSIDLELNPETKVISGAFGRTSILKPSSNSGLLIVWIHSTTTSPSLPNGSLGSVQKLALSAPIYEPNMFDKSKSDCLETPYPYRHFRILASTAQELKFHSY